MSEPFGACDLSWIQHIFSDCVVFMIEFLFFITLNCIILDNLQYNSQENGNYKVVESKKRSTNYHWFSQSSFFLRRMRICMKSKYFHQSNSLTRSWLIIILSNLLSSDNLVFWNSDKLYYFPGQYIQYYMQDFKLYYIYIYLLEMCGYPNFRIKFLIWDIDPKLRTRYSIRDNIFQIAHKFLSS